ncbi:MAG: carbamoyl-phosphate synthase large subunit [Elusimicrobiota bacterium]
MPRRTDIKKILLIGSGPIVISQACEFDYSGTQACKALKSEGYEVVLVNSNPATIMTDPEIADRTYIEPLTPEILEKIIERERPNALLPTLGGQTALNLAVTLHDRGILEKYAVEMIGANANAIKKAEDRDLFKQAMERIGLDVPRSGQAYNMDDARNVVKSIGFPIIIRPSFTLGGTGGGVAYNIEEFERLASSGLELSMIHEIMLEESLIGWKEFELEVMRDLKDNVVIICSIENLDPMGVHTGDSITVAPVQTLTDREYQYMRDASIKVIREIGVETGGSNIQFAVNQDNGRMVIIEMNPRVSRSSALASKATGFPIAKIAAKLAVGYTLDEIPNDITRETPASFEPTIDYCVVKIPRFTFEKFPAADPVLTTSMKSVGETMSIGRTFKEALQKGLRSLEVGRSGLGSDGKDKITDEMCKSPDDQLLSKIRENLMTPNADRIFYLRYAFLCGITTDEIYDITKIDRWFLDNIKEIIEFENKLKKFKFDTLTPEIIRNAKELGFSDRQLAYIFKVSEKDIRKLRIEKGVESVFKLVDTCAAEFEAYTPYYYSTYDNEDETRKSKKEKIMILGGGPNRIGQGIEFDYCCVHAAFALKEDGYETIMVNSNPETVSTDYDTSDKLYFEPLTLEDVLNIVDKEKPKGVIVQFGGQTPLNLAVPLQKAGVNILGTSSDSIDRAEDRRRFDELLTKLDLKRAPGNTAMSVEEAKSIAAAIGYPVLVRPSYVLGGRAMEIVYDEEALAKYMARAVSASSEHPVLVDKFLEDAIEVDVDAIADGTKCIICGVMEHIEEAGIHSGDSACAIPPYSLSKKIVEKIKESTYGLAKELNVIGLMNIQYAVKDNEVYILEVNPRASRTIPFVSKATGVAWAKLAAKIMTGKTLVQLGITKEVEIKHTAVKEAVFPFNRFPGVDPILSPEMKSTGEVMGIDTDFGKAYTKAELGAGTELPTEGKVFISVKERDRKTALRIAQKLVKLGFTIVATKGTADYLKENGIEVTPVFKVHEGARPNTVDLIKNREVKLLINTPTIGKGLVKYDQISIRSVAVQQNLPYITTMSGALAAINGIESLTKGKITIKSIQEYHKEIKEQNS